MVSRVTALHTDSDTIDTSGDRGGRCLAREVPVISDDQWRAMASTGRARSEQSEHGIPGLTLDLSGELVEERVHRLVADVRDRHRHCGRRRLTRRVGHGEVMVRVFVVRGEGRLDESGHEGEHGQVGLAVGPDLRPEQFAHVADRLEREQTSGAPTVSHFDGRAKSCQNNVALSLCLQSQSVCCLSCQTHNTTLATLTTLTAESVGHTLHSRYTHNVSHHTRWALCHSLRLSISLSVRLSLRVLTVWLTLRLCLGLGWRHSTTTLAHNTRHMRSRDRRLCLWSALISNRSNGSHLW